MNQPPMETLLSKIQSKYALVVVVAKRARMLAEQQNGEEEKTVKPVTRALHEVGEGKIHYERYKDGIK